MLTPLQQIVAQAVVQFLGREHGDGVLADDLQVLVGGESGYDVPVLLKNDPLGVAELLAYHFCPLGVGGVCHHAILRLNPQLCHDLNLTVPTPALLFSFVAGVGSSLVTK